MTIEFSPLSNEKQETNQVIENFSNFLRVKVSDEFSDDFCPTFYYDINDKAKTLSTCNIIKGIAYYTLTSEISNGQYELYYKIPCTSDLVTAGINFTLNIESINVLSISFSNENECTTSEVTEIIITTEKETVDSIYNAIVVNKQTEDKYQFNSCIVSGSTITCSSPSSIIIGGEYSLYQVNGDVRYNIQSIITKLIVDRLGFQFVTQQLYHSTEVTFFQVRLASATIAVPEIYFDSQGSNKVDCNRETNDETVLK